MYSPLMFHDGRRGLQKPGPFMRAGICALLTLALGACATVGTPAATPDFDGSMAQAHAAMEQGRPDAAVLMWREVAAQFPASKAPWLEIALLRASQGRHVDALEAGEQVLRRDPTDPVAHELTTASGLQVARRTMERLRATNATPDAAATSTARVIATLMADVFGPDFLVSDDYRAEIAREAVARYRLSRSERLPESRQDAPKGDPLDLLGGD